MIDAMTGAAAFVVNSRQDIIAANLLGRAFYAPVFESCTPANMARFTYLDPRAKDFFADWNRNARSSPRCGPPTTRACTAKRRSTSTTPS
jgi:MmyB-like transcription regulator ligand binding domain